MPKLAHRQKPIAAAAQAEVRTLPRSEKYGVVGAPLFPGIDLHIDNQIPPQFDARRDVFERLDKARTDTSFSAGGLLIDSSSSSSSLDAPQLRYVKLDEAFLSVVLRWVAGQQENDVSASASSSTLEVVSASAKRRAVLKAVLAHRISKLRASNTSHSAQIQALLLSACLSKSDLLTGPRTPRSDSVCLSLNEDEISSPGLAASNILRGQLTVSDKSLGELLRLNKASAEVCVSKMWLESSPQHYKGYAKVCLSEISYSDWSIAVQAVLNYTRDMQEDSYPSAPLRYLQQMSTGPPRRDTRREGEHDESKHHQS